jgi:hypothetical protein
VPLLDRSMTISPKTLAFGERNIAQSGYSRHLRAPLRLERPPMISRNRKTQRGISKRRALVSG